MWSLLLLSGALAACSPPEDPRPAATLLAAARKVLDKGDNATAIGLYEAAAEAARQTSDHSLQIEGLLGQGIAHQRERQYSEAEQIYRHALEVAGRSSDRAGGCKAKNRIGTLLRNHERSEEAARWWLEALEDCKAAGLAEEEGGALNGLGANAYRLGRAKDAERYYRDAAERAESADNEDLIAHVGYNWGNLEFSLGRFEEARERFQTALGRLERLGQTGLQVEILVALGWLERQAGQPGRALEHFTRARDLSAGLSSPSSKASVLHALGVAQRDQGKLADAQATLREAMRQRQALEDSAGEILSAGELAETLRLAGDLGAARVSLDEARPAVERAQDPGLEAFLLARSARVLRDLGNKAAAEAEMRRALDLFESANRSAPDPETRATQVAFLRRYFDEYIDLLMGRGAWARALEESERARARGLLGLLAEAQVDVESGVSPELKEQERRLEQQRSGAQALWLSKRGAGAPRAEVQAVRADLDELEAQRRALASAIRESNARYAEVRYPEPLGLAQIEKRLALDKDSALLEYALGEEHAYLFLLRSSGLETYDLGRTGDLRRRVQAALDALLDDRTAPEQYAILAGELYQSLLPARATEALERVERLIVVPDDVLFSFPFEALVTEVTAAGSPRYLVERWTVSYAPSATVLAGQASRPARQRAAKPGPADPGQPVFVGFGDPSYPVPSPSAALAPSPGGPERGLFDRDGRFRLDRLAASRDEVESIAGLFAPRPTSVYLGRDAREENVKANPQIKGTRYLHFAAHAFTDETDPDHFGLVLSQGLPSAEDGVLQLGEIFNLELEAELVVLSACSSGRGKPIKGEGFVGLTRGFFYAGARRLLVSLWNVQDVPSAVLMKRFYSHLLANGDAAEALRQAKLDLLQDGAHVRPEDWAGFVLTGVSR